MKNLFHFFISEYKLFIYPAVVGLASLVLIIFLIIPQIKNLLANQGNLNEEQKRLNLLDVKAKELEALDTSNINGKLLLTLSALPVDKDLPTIIGVLRNTANQSGIILQSIHFSQKGDKSYIVGADLVGTTSSLGVFLEMIEKSPRVMRVLSIDSGGGGAGNTITASVSIEVFYPPGPKSLGSVDAPLPKLSDKDQVILSNLSKTPVTSLISVASGSATPVSLAPAAVPIPAGKDNPFE